MKRWIGILLIVLAVGCRGTAPPKVKKDDPQKSYMLNPEVDAERGLVLIARRQNFVRIDGRDFGIAREVGGGSLGPEWVNDADVNYLYRKLSDIGKPLRPLFPADVVILEERLFDDKYGGMEYPQSEVLDILLFRVAEADNDGDGVVSPRDRNSLYVFFVGEERLQRVHPESINAGELVSVSASADRKSSWIVFRGKDDSKPSRGQRLFVYHVEKKHLEELRDGATP